MFVCHAKKRHTMIDRLKNIFSAKTKKKEVEPIQLFDKEGKPYTITRDEWINKVLPNEFKKYWDSADGLYNIIVMCLRDNIFDILLKPTSQLLKIDSDKSRSYLVAGIVYQKNDKLDNAEKIFLEGIKMFPNDGYFLTNLAKVYSQKGDVQLSYNTLWNAIMLDPNQENAVEWIGAIHFEKGGDLERIKILEQISIDRKSVV
jgi:tetratricopeptide (TPR) repeat protein